jgi:hypothetical protein
MEGLPHQPDSLAYMLQARWISHGSLEGEISAHQDRVQIPYTYLSDGRWLPHYPPGWPLLLAAGIPTGHHWLVAPLLGALLVVLIFLLGRETGGPAVGLAAAAIALVSPLTRLLSGSMLSHAAAGTAVAAVLWLGLLARRTASWPAAVAAGCCTAWVFAIRPLTAVAVALPLALYFLAGFDDRDGPTGLRRVAAVWFGAAALGSVPVLVGNATITGDPFSFPYSLAGRSMVGLEHLAFGIRNLDAMMASGWHQLFGWSVGPWWVGTTVPLAFAVIPFLARRARGSDLVLAAVVVSVVLAHLGTRGHGLHGFGPRYHFEALAALFVLTARGFQILSECGASSTGGSLRRPAMAAVGLFAVLNLSAAAALPGRLQKYRGYNHVTGALEKELRALGKQRLLVALPEDDWRGWAMAARLYDPRPGADLLFVEGRAGEAELFEIAEDRAVYIWDGASLLQASDSEDR